MIAPSTDSPRPPVLWMDISTSIRGRNSHATGTLRVERKLAAALSEAFGAQLKFCHFDPLRQRFAPAAMPEPPSPGSAASRGPGARDARSSSLGKRVERHLRRFVKDKIATLYRSRQADDTAVLFPDAREGDVLLLGGETWGERYDFETIARLRARGIRLAAICQDLIPLNHPQFFESEVFVARYRAYIVFLIREADLLMVISRSVADDVRRVAQEMGGLRGRLEVVILGSDLDARAAPQAPETLPPLLAGGFVITVSTIQSRKNVDLLYRVWRRFAEEGRTDVPRLVVVGQRGFGSADLLWQIENDPVVKESILLLHRVSDSELEWLYRHCRYTLYPSIAEGWGLPVSESLAHGKLCIASDATSIPEAGAGLALHLDPFDFKAWHDTVARLAENPAQIEAAERRIESEYRPRSWAASASELEGHLRGLLEGS